MNEIQCRWSSKYGEVSEGDPEIEF